ncbi:MAG: tryptophan synthase subunit alpha [Clostridium sp.]|uniref:tryptophan synthase subunit alpha n=1 Tax=Clostridium sp. DSM 8431 TaxID=1761781 RepID=UPI0008E64096|nr:tryptophan synthase subunit alpha [Clostridium sp. DSM 8431]MCR4943833.1 tryptophan synthase subunit alpha [Clostridium sp.]SFU48044.1 tryptophan synthase, alpha chain [Clostridium sp. DSM 8431]
MNRIDTIFENLKKEDKKALIPFISCGTPNLEETIDNVFELEKSGADIIEVGVPFSDPLADGEVIQNAYVKALKNGTKVKDVFTLGKKVREKSEVGLIIMVYYNLVYSRGVDTFLKEASEAGYDGIIVPDIPLEEREELQDKCEKEGLYLIPLVAPTSKERIWKIVEGTKGFVYCVSSTGTTGERSSFRADLKEYLDLVKEKSGIPICLGFGISSKEVVAQVKEYCDGVIVGSAVVRRLDENREKAFEFVKDLKEECE